MNRRAFSFVEIAIAILILALGVIPMISVFIANSEETRANKNRSVAAALASSVLERYRRFRPQSVHISGSKPDIASIESSKQLPSETPEITSDPLLTPPASDQKDEYLKDFVARTTYFKRVAYYQANPGGRSGTLTCTVFWKEKAAGTERVISYSLATLLTDPIFPTGREESQ